MPSRPHDHDHGLRHDLDAMIDRRTALKLLAGAGAVTLFGIGCGSGDSTATTPPATTTAGTVATAGTSTATSETGVTCTGEVIPQETAGPFPADGSNGPNVLSESGVVRSDITASFGTGSDVAPGVPLTLTLAILDANDGCSPIPDAAVYVWHCDRDGNYSIYGTGLENQNYLRGVQISDANGEVRFTSIFPGCYSGRWPHIHFEVYSSESDAVGGGTPVATSQVALPKAICDAVYATGGYEASATNMAGISLKSDNVFGDDGAVHQLARIGGDATAGVTASLTVPV